MPDCELLERCPFFHDRMKGMTATMDSLKDSYCKGDHSHCARYMVAKELGTAPAGLFPYQLDQAAEVLRRARKTLRMKQTDPNQ